TDTNRSFSTSGAPVNSFVVVNPGLYELTYRLGAIIQPQGGQPDVFTSQVVRNSSALPGSVANFSLQSGASAIVVPVCSTVVFSASAGDSLQVQFTTSFVSGNDGI